MQILRFCRIIKYWLQIVTGKKSYYVYILYNILAKQAEENKPCWALDVKCLLCSIGMGEVWYNQGVGDNRLFLYTFKQRLKDTFQQEWNSRLVLSPKARFYRVIKANFCSSMYLDKVNVKSHRIAMSKFLTSSHVLRIETDRWKRPEPTPSEERFCYRCLNKVEDEYHMVMECTLYSTLREQLIARKFWIRPSMYRLVNLITSTNRGLQNFFT